MSDRGGWRNSWDPPESTSYVEAWEDELPEHPVIAELRAQPGRWAVLKTPMMGPRSQETWDACRRHPNVQVESGFRIDERPQPYKARWLPDPVVAAMQVLRRGGYGQ